MSETPSFLFTVWSQGALNQGADINLLLYVQQVVSQILGASAANELCILDGNSVIHPSDVYFKTNKE